MFLNMKKNVKYVAYFGTPVVYI